MKTTIFVILIGSCLRCDLAVAQSFDCRKAASSTEKAICGSPALSALDARMAAAWGKSTKIFALIEGKEMLETLRGEQREWLGRRNACGGNLRCLHEIYEQRTAVLEFRPLPEAAPVDKFVGIFSHEGFMVVHVQRRDGTSARVLVDGAQPKDGRWICHFSGIGTVRENRLEALDTETGGHLVLERDGEGILIPDLDSNYATNRVNCGLNGMMNFAYRRIPQ